MRGNNQSSFNQNLLLDSLIRSSRLLVLFIKDIEHFTKEGIKEETVRFTREQFSRAFAHIAHYIGTDVLSLFVSEISSMPLVELMAPTATGTDSQTVS